MTRDEFDKQPLPPYAKLILEWACRRPAQRFMRPEIEKALYIQPFEVGDAIRILKHVRVGFCDPKCNGGELLIRPDAECRRSFGTYVAPVVVPPVQPLKDSSKKEKAAHV